LPASFPRTRESSASAVNLPGWIPALRGD